MGGARMGVACIGVATCVDVLLGPAAGLAVG